MMRPLLIVSLALPLTLLTAQDKPAAPPAAKLQADANGLTLPAGRIELPNLIAVAAAFLHRNILATSTELGAANQAAAIELQKQVVVDAAGCEELLSNLLYSRGFAVVPLDAQRGAYEVIALNGPRGREVAAHATPRSVQEVLQRPFFKQYVEVALPLQNINATVATAALRPFFAAAGNASPAPLTFGRAYDNSLLLSGFADQVAAAIRIVQECDQPMQRAPQPPPPSLVDRVAALEAALAKLQDKVDALAKRK